ncbi:paraquat-inducible protein A [Rhodovulum sp. DZ06]|uniref:paraquat-inducible protein A n=1 Tax=Rhodovulum sp. DZ06 TaxID=3425126 RepID=UPI003D335687
MSGPVTGPARQDAAPTGPAAPAADAPRAAAAALRVPPALFLANLSFVLLWPAAWSVPLLELGLVEMIGGRTVSVLGGLEILWAKDALLACLVALLGVVMPMGKTLLLAAVQAGKLRARALPLIEIAGKLSMADVFLLAMIVVVAKGVGIGFARPLWGLYAFALCVLASMLVSHLTKQKLRSAP